MKDGSSRHRDPHPNKFIPDGLRHKLQVSGVEPKIGIIPRTCYNLHWNVFVTQNRLQASFTQSVYSRFYNLKFK